MITQDRAKRLITHVVREQAMVLGGLAALDEIDDEAVWRLIRSLEAIRLRALRRVDQLQEDKGQEEGGTEPPPRPHPAIEEFLRRLGREGS